jgi:hypothetical protein
MPETLVAAQVQVRLIAVVEHKHFSVLERGHGARIDVQVDFDVRHRWPQVKSTPMDDAVTPFQSTDHNHHQYGTSSPDVVL